MKRNENIKKKSARKDRRRENGSRGRERVEETYYG
tara:strand:+ start:242 stop:346 length:105 start_codon:yes stop_codon:yes gene_type:complete